MDTNNQIEALDSKMLQSRLRETKVRILGLVQKLQLKNLSEKALVTVYD